MLDIVPIDIWYRIFKHLLSNRDIIALNGLSCDLRKFFNDPLLYTTLFGKRWCITNIQQIDIFTFIDLNCISRNQYISITKNWNHWLEKTGITTATNIKLVCDRPKLLNDRIMYKIKGISFTPNTKHRKKEMYASNDKYKEARITEFPIIVEKKMYNSLKKKFLTPCATYNKNRLFKHHIRRFGLIHRLETPTLVPYHTWRTGRQPLFMINNNTNESTSPLRGLIQDIDRE